MVLSERRLECVGQFPFEAPPQTSREISDRQVDGQTRKPIEETANHRSFPVFETGQELGTSDDRHGELGIPVGDPTRGLIDAVEVVDEDHRIDKVLQ